ncbi:hypothetical protein AB7W18_15315 [Providencia rettgeri]|uniref:hypothetical protein n=1 Tax=Providencia rettgeri TaxID=587 RepID=UPI001B392EFE|nr:hypothetical protein [Providencia rettgeri]MBQ0265666.1 hypothetical protein [Providencia rettgeri]
MTNIKPSITLMKILAGEGDFHLYRCLKNKRIFLFLKLLSNSLTYSFGKGFNDSPSSLVFIKGENQCRLLKYANSNILKNIDTSHVCCKQLSINNNAYVAFPKVDARYIFMQVCFLFLMLITGRRRYLNIYLILFYSGVNDVVNRKFERVKEFLCFNDQSYDVASIVEAFNQRGCQTFVYQHGLILSKEFYFPVVAKTFLAWGDGSRNAFKAWRDDTEFLVVGRYLDDAENKSDHLLYKNGGRKLKILIAPSFNVKEIKEIFILIKSFKKFINECSFVVKFHPATKFKFLIKLWCKNTAPFVVEEHGHMESLSNDYDFLITKNSTSTVDFLLRGKLVFCIGPLNDTGFPSSDYVFDIAQLAQLLNGGDLDDLNFKNVLRLGFLQKCINVG